MARLTDVHCHLLPPELRSPGAASWADPWFNQCHQGKSRFASGADVLAALDGSGLERAVVFGWPFADPGLLVEVNSWVAEEVDRSQGRLLGMALVNPARAGWEEELSRCSSLGLLGVGELNSDGQGFDLCFEGGLRDLLLTLAEMDWPLLLHASEPVGHVYPGKGTAWPGRLARLLEPALEAAPRLRVCLAHLGGGLPLYAEMPEVRELCRRLWFDTAALPYLYQKDTLASLEELLGPGRLCFGSDFPLLTPGRYREHLQGLPEAALRELRQDAPQAWLGAKGEEHG